MVKSPVFETGAERHSRFESLSWIQFLPRSVIGNMPSSELVRLQVRILTRQPIFAGFVQW